MRSLLAIRCGNVPFEVADEWQRELHRARLKGDIPDVVLLLEHPHVFTLGRRFRPEHLLVAQEFLAERGIALFEADRGGSITYHGPGQLVAYPIVDIRREDEEQPDVIRYLRTLEEAIIRCARYLGVVAQRHSRMTGVWVGESKLASIGVNVTRGVSRHGLALNVNTDLSYFDAMVPCGLDRVSMTSLQTLLQTELDLEDVAEVLVSKLGPLLHRRVTFGTRDDLEKAGARIEAEAEVIPLSESRGAV